MNRDTEVLKIQILADYYHSRFSSIASFIYGGTIAWLIGFVTLFLSKQIDVLIYTFALFAGIIAFAVFLIVSFRAYHESLNEIDKLIQQVNRGELLPSLKELRKKR